MRRLIWRISGLDAVKYYLLILTAGLWQEISWYHSSVFLSGSEGNISPEICSFQISEFFFTSEIISRILSLWKKSQGCFEHLWYILLFNKNEMFMSSTFKSGTHLHIRRVQLQRCYSKEVKHPQTCHAMKIDLVWLRHPTLPFYVGMFLKEYLVIWEHPYLLGDLN